MWGILAAALLRAEVDPVGRWACSATTPNGNEVPWTLEVSKKEGKLAVMIKSHRGDLSAPEPRLEGDVLSFAVTVGEGTFDIRLHIKGDQMEGSWKGGDASGVMKGSRK
jgi:hypothetical protein